MKGTKKLLAFFLSLVLVFTLLPAQNIEAASKVKLNKTKTTVYVGSSQTLKITGTKKKITWSSSDKKIATVNNKGKVTGKKAGKVTITAKVSGKKYKCNVTVKKPYINAQKKTLTVGKSFTLKLTGTKIKSVKSSNNKIAAISKKGVVTAKKAGNTTITLKGTDGKSYKCTITVNKAKKAHTHSYSSKVTKNATCKEKGVMTYTCSCGDSYTKEIAKLTEHTWNDGKVTTSPTCVKEGIKTYTCSICKTTKTEKLTKTDHKYTEKVTKAATCKEKGVKTYTCSCGAKYTKDIEKLTTHTTSNWIIDSEATCEAEGSSHTECTVCKVILETKTLDKKDHSYTWDILKAPSALKAASEADFGKRLQKCLVCEAEGITESMINIDGTKIICGVFDNDAADDLFDLVNGERNNAITNIEDEFGNAIGVTKVPSLERDTGLDFIAKLRAAQCAIRCDHWDKDGNPVYLTDNENLASGLGTARDTFLKWCYSTEHINAMIEYDYKTGGCANFWYDADGSGENLYPIWVLTLNKE